MGDPKSTSIMACLAPTLLMARNVVEKNYGVTVSKLAVGYDMVIIIIAMTRSVSLTKTQQEM